MKKILFDLTVCQPLGNIKYHGGGTYGYIIFKSLCEKSPASIIAYIDKNRFVAPMVIECIEKYGIQTVNAHEVTLLDALVKDVVIFYSPLFRSEYMFLKGTEIPIYVTFHGMRKLEMNKDCYEYLYATNWKNYIKALLKQTFLYKVIWKKFYNEYKEFFRFPNVNVVTVSNHSKSAIRYYYPSLKDCNIRVFYSPSTTLVDYHNIKPYRQEKYYLVISADRWLKNSYRALVAFDNVFKKFPMHKGQVIVVGLKRNKSLACRLKCKERFEFFDYVDKTTLESMYCGAYLLAYPSLNEGFGYPPLEAMKYGTPVISSAFSAIPEVCGDSVLYTNPYSVDELAMRIMQMENEKLYNEYRKKALIRYQYILKEQERDLDKLTSELLSFVK